MKKLLTTAFLLYAFKVIRIPLSVRYRYPGKIISPQAALGLNVYHINDGQTSEFVQDFVPSCLNGMMVKVYKNVSLSFNLEGDMLWNAYINASETPSFSRTNNIGVMISL
ncbi:MAG TPA: hypothetical protein VE912_14985 [Bacteroidales bacterium]|nr:hypothetical protein [Bacteroidales bacterium]